MKSHTRPLVIFALDSDNLELVKHWSEAGSLPKFDCMPSMNSRRCTVFIGIGPFERLRRLSLTALRVISQVVNAVGFAFTRIRS